MEIHRGPLGKGRAVGPPCGRDGRGGHHRHPRPHLCGGEGGCPSPRFPTLGQRGNGARPRAGAKKQS